MAKDWSIDLEHGDYQCNRALVIEDGLKAIEEIESGYYVNLVTPASFGNPSYYLVEAISQTFESGVTSKFIDQCGCGGYVFRVWKKLRSDTEAIKVREPTSGRKLVRG